MSNPETKDFGKEIIPQAVGNKKILSYQYEGYWTDIGNIDSFFEANIGLTDDVPKFNLFDNDNKIFTRPRLLPPSKFNKTMLDKSILSEGCIINAKEIKGSVIGIRARIGVDTVIENSYIMGNDFYQSLEEIESDLNTGSILVGIGERCFISNALVDKNYAIKDGIVVIKKAAIIPNNFKIG